MHKLGSNSWKDDKFMEVGAAKSILSPACGSGHGGKKEEAKEVDVHQAMIFISPQVVHEHIHDYCML